MSQTALNHEPAADRQPQTPTVSRRGVAMSAGFVETTDFLGKLIRDGAGIYLLTGERGIGKTTALDFAAQEAPENVVVITHPFKRIDVDNLSDLLGHTLGVKLPHDLPPEARALRYFLKLGTIRSKGKRLILMLDNVEELHSSGAELLKALVNMKDAQGPLITVILCGGTALNAFLDTSYRWGIQRLIRAHHEMQGFTGNELPALLDTVQDNASTEVPIKNSAISTLFQLSRGVPGEAVRLFRQSTAIVARHKLTSISPRVVKGAASGNFQTLQQVATGFAGKAVMAIALLLLVPITQFQQNLQQQELADRPPGLQPADTAVETVANTEPLATEVVSPLTAGPQVATVADDIAPTPIQSAIETQGTQPTAVLDSLVANQSAQTVRASEYQFDLFNTRIFQESATAPQPDSPAFISFNIAIEDQRTSLTKLLNRYQISIPATPGFR